MPIDIDASSGLATTTIDGRTYEFEQWGAKAALDTLMDLAATLGQPLTKLLALASEKPNAKLADVLESEGGVAGLDDIVQHLIAQISDHRARTMRLIESLASAGVLCGGKVIAFDAHYQNQLAHMFKVVRINLEVQYGDFLDAVAPFTGLQRARPAA